VKPPLSPDIMRDRQNLPAPIPAAIPPLPVLPALPEPRFNSRWSFECTTLITGPISTVNLKRGALTKLSDGNVGAP
jgi:hypothetical protein